MGKKSGKKKKEFSGEKLSLSSAINRLVETDCKNAIATLEEMGVYPTDVIVVQMMAGLTPCHIENGNVTCWARKGCRMCDGCLTRTISTIVKLCTELVSQLPFTDHGIVAQYMSNLDPTEKLLVSALEERGIDLGFKILTMMETPEISQEGISDTAFDYFTKEDWWTLAPSHTKFIHTKLVTQGLKPCGTLKSPEGIAIMDTDLGTQVTCFKEEGHEVCYHCSHRLPCDFEDTTKEEMLSSGVEMTLPEVRNLGSWGECMGKKQEGYAGCKNCNAFWIAVDEFRHSPCGSVIGTILRRHQQ